LRATSPRPPSPGHSTLSGSYFASLLLPLSRAFRSARTTIEKADRRHRKHSTRTHLAALVYFHVVELKSTRSLVRELGKTRPLRRLAHWSPTHVSCVADANNRRDPGAFAAWPKRRVGHRLPSRLRSVLAVDSSCFRAIRTMLSARYRKGERGVCAHLAFDADQRLPRTPILHAGASDERAAARRMIRGGVTYLMDRGYPGCRLLHAIKRHDAFFLCRLPLDAPLQRLRGRPAKKLDPSIREDSFVLYAPDRRDSAAGRLLAVRRRGEEDVFLLTNRMDLEAHGISTLYRQRSAIELFFRSAKSNEGDRHWIGRTRNAVVLQFLSRLSPTSSCSSSLTC
jgi:DDE family transposase